MNINFPKSFNEKLQWLKLHDKNSNYTMLVDKFEVRKYISSTIGEEYLIPLLGVWDSFDEIDFNSLPNQFVLKCTHDSGGVIICKNKNDFDKDAAKRFISKHFKKNYFYHGREFPYKNIIPKIICEEYMVDETNMELKDYKIFCFNGEPKFVQVDYNRFSGHKRNIYDTEWNYIPLSIHYPTDPNVIIKKPNKFDEMVNLSAVLAKNIPFLRVDFYSVNDKIYFGEMTFYHGSGFEKFEPEYWNNKLGELIKLPNI